MGMGIGTINSNGNKIVALSAGAIKNSLAGTIRISKPNNVKKKKRLFYSFKKISNQIMMSKTSSGAARTVTKAKITVVTLLMRKRSGEYDDTEVDAALEHAKSMERVAKKRKRHIEEEERAKYTGETMISEEMEADPEKEAAEAENEEAEEESRLSEEELKKLEEELEEELEELTEESLEESLKEMADAMVNSVHEDMSPEEIKDLERRHRSDELKDIMEADIKYMKALFEKLQKDKQASRSAALQSYQEAVSSSDGTAGAVSLELSGVEVPVEAQPSAAEVVEGANVDVSV